MSSARFSRFALRTHDLAGAQAFYEQVVGWRVESIDGASCFVSDRGVALSLTPLPERARARGAPAHWLGHVGAVDVAATRERLVAQGAEVLGPSIEDARGATAVLRDPLGAVLAITSREERASSSAVAWHELHTTDRDRAWTIYAELFGWTATDDLDLELGSYRMFTWAGAERASVGGMANTARRPGVHPHWLFYFAVDDVDEAVARVRALGGVVADGPRTLPSGDRTAVCDDAQGAAFGLRQRAR